MRVSDGVVGTWLGDAVHRLHPALRMLHATGGHLAGVVDAYVADHLAGRRLARRMGLQVGASRVPMRVDVVPRDGDFLWIRRFGEGPAFVSRFEPTGLWPVGAWRERTGRVSIEFGADLADGGWRWVQRRTRIGGMTLPAAMAPRVSGDKRMVDDRYRFTVELALPVLGTALRYGGDLAIVDVA